MTKKQIKNLEATYKILKSSSSYSADKFLENLKNLAVEQLMVIVEAEIEGLSDLCREAAIQRLFY